jgi:acetyl esterase/lipase
MARAWRRRAFLRASSAAATCIFLPSLGRAGAEDIRRETVTFKKVGGCEIKADVYGSSGDRNRPVAVWIHGGALIMGDRRGIDPTLLSRLIESGYTVVSIDYRLAPEAKLPEILTDVKDAFAWIRGVGSRIIGNRDGRVVVLGGSAGGYLTLASGYLIEPRPAALVSFWGYGDIAGPWYSRPDPFYRLQPLVTEAEARGSVGSTAIAEPPAKNQRFRFYLYCRQNGLWPKEVTGHDPDAEPKAFDALCPLRRVTAGYPPTLLVHGTTDTDVPHEQSVLMDRELARRGVPHELVSVRGAGHGLGGVDRKVVSEIHDRVLAFLQDHSA